MLVYVLSSATKRTRCSEHGFARLGKQGRGQAVLVSTAIRQRFGVRRGYRARNPLETPSEGPPPGRRSQKMAERERESVEDVYSVASRRVDAPLPSWPLRRRARAAQRESLEIDAPRRHALALAESRESAQEYLARRLRPARVATWACERRHSEVEVMRCVRREVTRTTPSESASLHAIRAVAETRKEKEGGPTHHGETGKPEGASVGRRRWWWCRRGGGPGAGPCAHRPSLAHWTSLTPRGACLQRHCDAALISLHGRLGLSALSLCSKTRCGGGER